MGECNPKMKRCQRRVGGDVDYLIKNQICVPSLAWACANLEVQANDLDLSG